MAARISISDKMSGRKQWATYEQQVFELFKEHFPRATARRNVYEMGRFSKRKRQIDVLLTEHTPAGILKTVVDTKFFKRKVDVKAVDTLAGFVEDVDAHRGMLITSMGYTRAALRRAFYGPSNLELDVLNFSELQKFQSFTAIPYSGDKAFLITAPFGWVIDASRTEGRIANLYQRGLDVESAEAKKELLYINLWHHDSGPLTMEELDARQVARIRQFSRVEVTYRPTIERPDARTRMRIAHVVKYGCLEVTGFLEFADVIFFAVLLTSIETQGPNIRRLESVLQQAAPIELMRDNTGLINNLRDQLETTSNAEERAMLLRRMAYWYKDMGQFSEARDLLERSLSIDPDNAYWSIRELMPVLQKLREADRAKELLSILIRLDPHNPTVFNDSINLAAGWIFRSDVLEIINKLREERCDDPMTRANCDFYSANLLAPDDPSAARRLLLAARRQFIPLLPSKHQVFRAIREALKQFRSFRSID